MHWTEEIRVHCTTSVLNVATGLDRRPYTCSTRDSPSHNQSIIRNNIVVIHAIHTESTAPTNETRSCVTTAMTMSYFLRLVDLQIYDFKLPQRISIHVLTTWHSKQILYCPIFFHAPLSSGILSILDRRKHFLLFQRTFLTRVQ